MRNTALLSGYDYDKSAGGITGYAGQDLQRITRLDRSLTAIRTRVGERGNYKGAVTLVENDALALVVCREKEHDLFHLIAYRSTDLGLTWDEVGDTGLRGKEPALMVAADGALLMTAQHGDFRAGAPGYAALIARSTDGGCTWSEADRPIGDYPRNVLVDTDGSLLFLSASGSDDQILTCRSHDHGVTWDAATSTIPWSGNLRAEIAEISVLRRRDGRLLAALRHDLPQSQAPNLPESQRGHGFADTLLTESDDDGATWSTPVRLTEIGEVHTHLLQLRDGRLLATYVNYHLPFGVCAMVSCDDGRTWGSDLPFQLSCAAFGPANNGWPVTVELDDGSLLTCYAANAYPNEGSLETVCETVRWHLPAQFQDE